MDPWARIAELEKEIESLKQMIEELRKRLGLDSTNSSKPPSSDGLKKKPVSLREKGEKPFGGQPNHKGKTLRMVDNPDIIVKHELKSCQKCQAGLEAQAIQKHVKRQVVDLKIEKIITEHQAEVKICHCGHKNTALFPAGVENHVQYGSGVRSIACYLSDQFIPKDRLSLVFQDLFGIEISDTTLMQFEASLAENVTAVYNEIEYRIKNCEVKGADESGIRVANTNHWLHVLCTAQLTHYRIDQKRGAVPEGVQGLLVHDCYKPYFGMENVKHALCNAHLLRELKSLMQFEKEEWAKSMDRLLRLANKNASLTKYRSYIEFAYDSIVHKGLAYHESLEPLDGRKKRTGHNLLVRLQNYKTEILRFLYDAKVPFSNNQAEQDIRMIKTKQKVSGCFRTKTGADIFATIRSCIATARKYGINIYTFLQKAVERPMETAIFFNL